MNTRPPPLCQRCGRAGTFYKVQVASGWKVTCRCPECGHRPCLANRAWFKAALFDLSLLPALDIGNAEPCEVCGTVAPLEAHHLAPRSRFGDECSRWPVVLVCRPCHARWHELMGCPWRRP